MSLPARAIHDGDYASALRLRLFGLLLLLLGSKSGSSNKQIKFVKHLRKALQQNTLGSRCRSEAGLDLLSAASRAFRIGIDEPILSCFPSFPKVKIKTIQLLIMSIMLKKVKIG
jgi:hypothetical protein